MATAIVEQLKFPFKQFEDELINPISGHKLDEFEEFIASLLLDASSEQPIKSAEIIEAVKDQLDQKISFRKLKIIVRSLRRDHGFPILTRRSKPAGYWWCCSKKEMNEFKKMWRSQVTDESITLAMMERTFNRSLAGQKNISNLPEK